MSLGFTTWNIDNGFVDAMVRGWRSTFLSDTEYSNLKEGGRRGVGAGGLRTKEDFEDMRLTLQETDYGSFLAAEPALDPKLIGARATAKWVREFAYFRASATGDLGRFLDFVAYEYMIDNILDLIKAATSSQTVDAQAVVSGCHPLGLLDESVMKSILAFEDLGEDFHALYRTVLVDTPVGCVGACRRAAPSRAAPGRRPAVMFSPRTPTPARAASTLRNFCARWPRRARRRTLSTCARRLRRSPCR